MSISPHILFVPKISRLWLWSCQMKNDTLFLSLSLSLAISHAWHTTDDARHKPANTRSMKTEPSGERMAACEEMMRFRKLEMNEWPAHEWFSDFDWHTRQKNNEQKVYNKQRSVGE